MTNKVASSLLELEDPPNTGRGRRSTIDWDSYIKELAKHPNRFAKLKNLENSENGNRFSQLANSIKNGRISAFKNSGFKFDARSTKEALYVMLIDPNAE